jgi:hypothetical protein
MFTPSTYSIGDLVKTTEDLSNEEGTFTVGREFRIIDIHLRHDGVFYDLRDHELNVIMDVPPTSFSRA